MTVPGSVVSNCQLLASICGICAWLCVQMWGQSGRMAEGTWEAVPTGIVREMCETEAMSPVHLHT